MTGRRPSPHHPAARALGADLAATARVLMARTDVPLAVPVDTPQQAVALAAMAIRGRQHRTQAQFALAYGLSEEQVAQIEDGSVAVEDLPAVLRVLTPVESVVGLCLGLGPAVVGLAGRRTDQ